jgi:hypothetical protein
MNIQVRHNFLVPATFGMMENVWKNRKVRDIKDFCFIPCVWVFGIEDVERKNS